jgi:hypothetical protein
MTEDEARVLLEAKTAHDSAPFLTPDEIDALLTAYNVVDDGWNLDAAAAEGWAWKAGKVAPDYSFSQDGQLSDQGQVHRHCVAQKELYERKAGGITILSVRSPYAEDLPELPEEVF